MKTFYTKIGDHLIFISLDSLRLMDLFKKGFSILPTRNEDQPDLMIHIEGGYGMPFENYEVSIRVEIDKVIYQRADYLIEVDKEFHSANIFVHDELALKHALMNLYSTFIVNQNWGLLLHSSCAIENGSAHIFAGHSGAGKSTAAKLSSPRELLSDEATLVKISKDSITVYHSPFRSELETSSSKENIPLGSVQLLKQSLVNERILLKQSDAFLQLIDKVFYWPHREEEVSKVLGLLRKVVRQVPIYELQFQKNNTFWELIS